MSKWVFVIILAIKGVNNVSWGQVCLNLCSHGYYRRYQDLFWPAPLCPPTGSARGRVHFEITKPRPFQADVISFALQPHVSCCLCLGRPAVYWAGQQIESAQQPDDPVVWWGIGCLCTSCFGRQPLRLEIPFSPKEVIILGKGRWKWDFLTITDVSIQPKQGAGWLMVSWCARLGSSSNSSLWLNEITRCASKSNKVQQSNRIQNKQNPNWRPCWEAFNKQPLTCFLWLLHNKSHSIVRRVP